MAATINIPWNEYEAVLLVEACNKVISGEASKSDVIPELSSRLRGRMLSQKVWRLVKRIATKTVLHCNCRRCNIL